MVEKSDQQTLSQPTSYQTELHLGFLDFFSIIKTLQRWKKKHDQRSPDSEIRTLLALSVSVSSLNTAVGAEKQQILLASF